MGQGGRPGGAVGAARGPCVACRRAWRSLPARAAAAPCPLAARGSAWKVVCTPRSSACCPASPSPRARAAACCICVADPPAAWRAERAVGLSARPRALAQRSSPPSTPSLPVCRGRHCAPLTARTCSTASGWMQSERRRRLGCSAGSLRRSGQRGAAPARAAHAYIPSAPPTAPLQLDSRWRHRFAPRARGPAPAAQ